MYKNIELLAPAGSYDSVIAALNGGCDAIYIGGANFNARAYADSPTDEKLKEIIDICHLRAVKVFITVNILYKEKELPELINFISKMYEYGADGFIIQDWGLFCILKESFPNVELHASTQMTIHNSKAAQQSEKLGFHRVVLSRELSLEEIHEITKVINIDTECFVHGALCVSYSGRCLMSSMIGGRSGNRGRCAQPCRMEYSLVKNKNVLKKGYLLSLKDMSTAEMTKTLMNAGIYSFKIEGRMKSPEYVYMVVSAYRKAVDNGSISQEELKNLTQIFNRGGSLQTGYYKNWAGADMMSSSPKSSGTYAGQVIKCLGKSVKIKLTEDLHKGDGIEIWNKGENTGCGISQEFKAGQVITLNVKGNVGSPVYKSFDKNLNDYLKKQCKTLDRQRKVSADVNINVGKATVMELKTPEGSVKVQGEVVSAAENQPITKESLVSRLSKTGNTPFVLEFDTVYVDENAYLPVSALNNLKRQACEALEKKIIDFYARPHIDCEYKKQAVKLPENKYFTVLVQNEQQFSAALEYNVRRIYVELSKENCSLILKNISAAHSKNIELYAAMPKICRNSLSEEYKDIISCLENSELDGYLVRSMGSIETQKNVVYDYSFNVFNSKTRDFLLQTGGVCLSPELNTGELKAVAGENTEIVVYGRLTLMTTHQCPIGLYDAQKKGKFCSKKNNHEQYFITDRKNAEFPVMTHCESCTAFILNSAPLNVLNKWEEIDSIPTQYRRLEFTTEDKTETKNILNAYINGGPSEIKGNFTGGHYFRGVL